MANPDVAPRFWTEPWHWAAPAWRRTYGAPPRDLDCFEARLAYRGWAASFGLVEEWRAPADERWLSIVQASPAVLRGVTAALGYIALLRVPLSGALRYRKPMDHWFALALRYREINCIGSAGGVMREDLSEAGMHGVRVLRIMARQDWPEVDSRIAMLAVPDARQVRREASIAPHASSFVIERVDVGRCLSICAAIVRHSAAESIPSVKR
ncbi:hypothetical protein [Trinickia diaoshuihuensis]|uniref:hypothetical protein n=1 Tax=Trinickia diaoshuihuensis TaxID=2292265 RepID=UPI000E278737|nr:hypothetical protein [Trinickia diaoshuihuensis]